MCRKMNSPHQAILDDLLTSLSPEAVADVEKLLIECQPIIDWFNTHSNWSPPGPTSPFSGYGDEPGEVSTAGEGAADVGVDLDGDTDGRVLHVAGPVHNGVAVVLVGD